MQAVRAWLASGELELLGHVTQVAAAVAPVVVKNVPAAQSVHAALPVAILYLPATQAVHVPPVNPALHAWLEQTVAPTAEIDPAGHAVHAWSPVTPLNVFAAH
jgi:pimeloyl-ACP methyl ester carboxylesterase